MKFRTVWNNYINDSKYSQWRWAYIFLAVDLAWSILFLFYPLIRSFVFSFQEFTLANIGDIHFIGLKNYIEILTDVNGWWHSVFITSIWTVCTVPVNIAISLSLSLLISPLGNRAGNFYKSAFYLPAVVSQVVISVIMVWIFSPMSGLANMILEFMGLPALKWYGSPDTALFTLMLMVWLSGHGMSVLLYTAALKRIPVSLYEAADIDATPAWSKFWKITWPLLKPTTLYVLIVQMIGAFQTFSGAFFITKGGPMRSTEFVNWRIYRTFYDNGNFGMASAMAVILMIVIMTISLINFKYLGSDVEY
ncbi:MAG: carbohydrate ABC transporter permease [Halanaerobiales bacterium]